MIWVKPSGIEIETNDAPATVEHCRSLGWEEKKPKAKPKAKPKSKPTKAEES